MKEKFLICLLVLALLTPKSIHAEKFTSLLIVDSSGQPLSDVRVQILTETNFIQELRSDSNGVVIIPAIPEGNYTFVLFKENFGYSRYQIDATNLPTRLTLYTFEESVGEPVELTMEESAEPNGTIANEVEPCFIIDELVSSSEWTNWLKTSEVHSTKFMTTIYRDYYSTSLELTWTYSYNVKVRSESEGWEWKVGGSTSISNTYNQVSGHEITASNGEDMTIYQQFTLRYEHWIRYLLLVGGAIIKVNEWEKVFVKNIYPASFRPVMDKPPGDDEPCYRELGWLGTQDATDHGFTTIIQNTVSTSLSVSFYTEFSSDLFGSTSISTSGKITLGRTICYELTFQKGHKWELYTKNTFIIYLGLYLGDLNGDRKIDLIDVGIVYRALGSNPRNPACDFNFDGKVDWKDLSIEFAYYFEWQTRYYPYAPPGIETTVTSFGQAINTLRHKYP